jgi:hypothetical protein
MPYYPQGTRWEFGTTDRQNLVALGVAALAAMQSAYQNKPIPRSSFDQFSAIVDALAPTINITGPWPEVILPEPAMEEAEVINMDFPTNGNDAQVRSQLITAEEMREDE